MTEIKETAKSVAEKEVSKTAAKPAAKKAEANKVEAKKAEPKKTEAKKVEAKKPAAKKPAAKKPAAKKPAAKKAVKAAEKILVQFDGKEIDVEDIKKNISAELSAAKVTAKNISIYVKPEDGKAYYVADDVTGSIDL